MPMPMPSTISRSLPDGLTLDALIADALASPPLDVAPWRAAVRHAARALSRNDAAHCLTKLAQCARTLRGAALPRLADIAATAADAEDAP